MKIKLSLFKREVVTLEITRKTKKKSSAQPKPKPSNSINSISIINQK